jgi:hypothetical protein
MKKLIISALAFILTLSGSCLPVFPLRPLTLSAVVPGDGTGFTSNVQKVTGLVSDPCAGVTVNGQPADVDGRGYFTGYAELTPGEGTIEVKATRGIETITHTSKVSFRPPSAVWLDGLVLEPGKDYSREPLQVTGKVSNPGIRVTVNGINTTIESNGTFSVAVPLNFGSSRIASVIAVGAGTDVYARRVYWRPDNAATFVEYLERFPLYWPGVSSPGDLTLKRGDDVTVELIFEAGKHQHEPVAENWRLRYSSNLGREVPPPGLSLSLVPSHFTVYPNGVYAISLRIKVGAGTTPGTYLYSLEGDTYQFSLPAMSFIMVTVAA